MVYRSPPPLATMPLPPPLMRGPTLVPTAAVSSIAQRITGSRMSQEALPGSTAKSTDSGDKTFANEGSEIRNVCSVPSNIIC